MAELLVLHKKPPQRRHCTENLMRKVGAKKWEERQSFVGSVESLCTIFFAEFLPLPGQGALPTVTDDYFYRTPKDV